MLPAERRDVLEDVIGRDPAVPAQMRDGAAEIDGVPVHDGADDEIEAGGAEGLALEGAIADFAALVEGSSMLIEFRPQALQATGQYAVAMQAANREIRRSTRLTVIGRSEALRQ